MSKNFDFNQMSRFGCDTGECRKSAEKPNLRKKYGTCDVDGVSRATELAPYVPTRPNPARRAGARRPVRAVRRRSKLRGRDGGRGI